MNVALVDGEVSYSKAVIINRLKRSEDIIMTLKFSKSSGMSDKQLKAHIIELQNENTPSDLIKPVSQMDSFKKDYSKITKAKYNKLTEEEKMVVDNAISEMSNLYPSISTYFK